MKIYPNKFFPVRKWFRILSNLLIADFIHCLRQFVFFHLVMNRIQSV